MAGIGLNTGLKALLTAQAALETIGHNVSNANTAGYSRQRLDLSASPYLLVRGLNIGSGVDALRVMRTTDALVQARIVAQGGSIAKLDARLSGMNQVQALLGEPGEFGLSSLMQSMYTSFSSLAADPEDLVLRTSAVQSAVATTSQMNHLASSFAATKADVAGQIKAQVKQVNLLADDVVRLNQEIANTEAGGLPANDLRDQRDETIRMLGQYVNVTTAEAGFGKMTVTVGGRLLVGANRAYDLSTQTSQAGDVSLHLEGSTQAITAKSGSLGGLMAFAQEFLPQTISKLDGLAKQMIFEANKAHSTGIPGNGPFTTLTAQHALVDVDEDGTLGDERLLDAGLPFDVSAGVLRVNMTDSTTGAFTSHTIAIEADTTVDEFLAELNDIPHLSASLDTFGRLQLVSESGHGFDFSRKTQGAPDTHGTFGGEAASLGTQAGPFALNAGDTISLQGPGGLANITLSVNDFADINNATADELATVLNNDASVQAAGLRAVVVGDRLAMQTTTTGVAAEFTVLGGSALTELGWTTGTVSGAQRAVAVTMSGAWTGTTNDAYTFTPTMDGTVGTTAGLSVEVRDASGALVTTLDLGPDYTPGEELELPNGLKVSFGLGELSATHNDAFVAEAWADSDTSDALAALGLNALYTGTSAIDIGVREDLVDDPRLFSVGTTGASGDNRALLDLVDLKDLEIDALGGATIGDAWGDFVANIGFDIGSAENARGTEQFLMESLVARREEVSGVNVDEELVNMVRFEQAYQAAARYIQAVNSINDELMRII